MFTLPCKLSFYSESLFDIWTATQTCIHACTHTHTHVPASPSNKWEIFSISMILIDIEDTIGRERVMLQRIHHSAEYNIEK